MSVDTPAGPPKYFAHVPLKVENTVKLAGATCYRCFLIQSGVSFLSGSDDYADDANFEAKARANVGLSRAIGSTIIVSPVDMRSLIGMAQVLAALQIGVGRVDTNSLVAKWDCLVCGITSDEAMRQALLGDARGSFPLPLAVAWVSKCPLRHHARRLHLVLVEARNFQPSVAEHPAFPGGSFIGLLWG